MTRLVERRYMVIAACAVCLAVITSCKGDSTAPSVSSLDGHSLNASIMDALRRTEQGCFFSISDPSGGRRILDLRGRNLPFTLPAIAIDPITNRGNGRAINTAVFSPDIPEPITVSCWIPGNLSFDSLTARLSSVRWKPLYVKLRRARLISRDVISRPLSREMQQYRFEMLQADPVQAAPMVSSSEASREAPYSALVPSAIGPVSAYLDEWVWNCAQAVWDVEIDSWYIVCTYTISGAQSLTGVTVQATPDPWIDWSSYLPQVEYDFCGYIGCYDDSGGGGGLPLQVDITAAFANNDSSAGQTVYFHGVTQWESLPEGASVSWSWTSEAPSDPTTVNGSCFNNVDCNIPVYAEGRMDFFVQVNGESGFAFEHIQFAVPPCNGATEQADLDDLRKQYRSSPSINYTMPACGDFQHQPSGFVGWSIIQSHGDYHSHAIYRSYLDAALLELSTRATVVITTSNRVYSTPKHQLFLNPGSPNSRHIYGDAADIHSDSNTWEALRTAAKNYSEVPCVEPETLSQSAHVHVDYRRHLSAIRRWTGPCPNGW
jgi:hypothetical protein